LKIAIVEVSESHEECIYTQVSFLKDAGHSVSLFIHPKIEPETSYYKGILDNISIINFDILKGLQKIKLEWKITQALKHFDKIIFNTASSSKSVRNICLFLKLYKVEAIGIIHSVTKLNNSFTQRIISTKIKKYLALNDFLKVNITLKNQTLKLASFYPIFFPNTPKTNIESKKSNIWICIPGRVYFNRRDYDFLTQKLLEKAPLKNIKFIILGNINTNDGILFKEFILKHNLKNSFIFFEGFIKNSDYYNYIYNSDYIMPILQTKDEVYLKDKITGTFNLAFGYKKPLLCNAFYKSFTDLAENGLFYTDSTFHKVIASLTTKPQPKNSYQSAKWSYNYQKNKYLNFVVG